jgi:hypothetical protein
MTIREGAQATGLVMDDFYRTFKIPEKVPADIKMKEIGDVVPGYDFEKMKDAVVAERGAGQPAKVDVQGIIGSMSIKEAAEAVGVGVKDYYALFKIPDTVPEETKMKDIKDTVPGYDFHKVRDALK